MRVLLVDDERALLEMYRDKLTTEGFDVVTAIDGQSALEKAQTGKFDVILLDIIMPKLNGLDVLKALKTVPVTEKVPVYLLTNIPEQYSEAKVKELGASGYLFKADTEPEALAKFLKELDLVGDASGKQRGIKKVSR